MREVATRKARKSAKLRDGLPRVPYVGGGDEGGGPIRVERRHPLTLPPDGILRNTFPRLWQAYDRHFPDEKRPLAGRIWLELIRRYSYLLLSNKIMANPIQQFQRLNSEISQLLDLVPPAFTSDSCAHVADQMLAHIIRNTDLGSREASDIVKQWKRQVGRPPLQRPLAVRALEMQTLDPKLTWSEIASRVGYPKAYQRPLSETLPAEVRHVKRILQGFGLLEDRRRPSH